MNEHQESCCCTQPDAELAPVQIDPVCGMSVSDLSKPNIEYQGQRYYFCGKGCLNKFQTHPEDYLAALKAKKSACGCAVKKI